MVSLKSWCMLMRICSLGWFQSSSLWVANISHINLNKFNMFMTQMRMSEDYFLTSLLDQANFCDQVVSRRRRRRHSFAFLYSSFIHVTSANVLVPQVQCLLISSLNYFQQEYLKKINPVQRTGMFCQCMQKYKTKKIKVCTHKKNSLPGLFQRPLHLCLQKDKFERV